MSAAIELEGVHKWFGPQHVLRGVDLEIESGAITSIIGFSGAGKSVLLKHVIGLIRPDRGTIRVRGTAIEGLRRTDLMALRRRFGYLFQGGALFDSMSVADNVAFPLREHTGLRPREVDERVRAMLDELSLTGMGDKFPAELSGGMRKRAALARAIVLDPEILLYDEPTTGLDPVTTEQVNELIVDTHRAHNATTLIISHDLAAAFRISDRVVFLHDGVVAEQGSPEALRQSRHLALAKFIDAARSGVSGLLGPA
jgi:phospholipid/cholesterol/gamma-HCH transport system ATP-binding protein